MLPLSRTTGAQRIIAFGRVLLAVFAVAALAMDPPPERFATLTSILLYVYMAYAIWQAILGAREASRTWLFVRHCADLVMFSIFTLLNPTSNTPFFLGFIFLVVCAALLFDTAWTIYTAVAVVAAYAIIVFIARFVMQTGDFSLWRLVMRIAFLSIITSLLVELKIHETQVLRDTEKLAEWPRRVPVNLEAMLGDMIEQASDLLNARVIIIWQDVADSAMRVATMNNGEVAIADEVFAASNPPLDRNTPATFLDANLLSESFRRRYGINHVLGCRFDGESASGWLLAAGKTSVTGDDVVLADIVAGLVESRFDQFYLAERLRQNTLADERVRFARDLHDGILQSLSGTAMHLQRLRELIARDPDAARASLEKVQAAIVADQQDVRSYVDRLRSAMLLDEHPLLGTRLESLAERVMGERGIQVRIETSPIVEMMSPGMSEEAYRLIREAVMNAATHSGASSISVEVTIHNEHVRVIVEDNGHGFGFKGNYDLHALTLQRRGPVVLKERVWALMGNLTIDSKPTGARLEIDLPVSLAKVPM